MTAILYPPDPTLDAAAYDAALDEFQRRRDEMRDANDDPKDYDDDDSAL